MNYLETNEGKRFDKLNKFYSVLKITDSRYYLKKKESKQEQINNWKIWTKSKVRRNVTSRFSTM